MRKELQVRMISGTILIIVAVSFSWLGGWPLLAMLFLFAIVGIMEFYRAVGLLEDGKYINPITLPGYLCTAALYIISYFETKHLLQLFLILALSIITMAIYVFTFPKYDSKKVAYVVFGFIYMPVMLSYIYHVRSMENGIYTVFLIYIVSSICDIFAYFVGMAIGKHRLAPIVSPKKSIEGSIGGVVASVLFGFLYAKFVMPIDTKSVIEIVIACLICSMVSQIGDLAASAVKRDHNIKDYGKILPGQGGVLDRLDSIIFTAPIVYFLLVFFGQK